MRGIRPLSQTNVVVPELVMTFDLAGIPYKEPCFANTKYRNTTTTSTSPHPLSDTESSRLLPPSPKGDYHKTRWHKGLVGVVYEVTRSDYAHIIATEGGGASYQDVLVACHALPANTSTVPEHPTTQPFKAHTLYFPVIAPGDGEKLSKNRERFSRPDPNYAQASARYLKLITDGADEHALPGEYKDYLHQIRPYTMTTRAQRMGASIFGMLWLPVISAVFGLNRMFADKDGRVPGWLAALMGTVFKGVWVSYDAFFKGMFGDGERTIYEDGDGEERRDLRASLIRYGAISEKDVGVNQAV